MLRMAGARGRRTTARLVLISCCLVWAALAADSPAPHVRNFGKVNEHLYRGGDPTLVGIQELGALGVKLDIDLREAREGTEVEKKAAEKLGMKYVNIPFPPLSAPSDALVQRVLSLLTGDKSETVFVHCRRGKDRTGTVIACYRIQHDGWDHPRALAEARSYGMSRIERGMRSYIIRFTPLPPVAVAPAVK